MSAPRPAPANSPSVARRRPRPTFHHVTVSDVTALTPRMRRVAFTGPELTGYPNEGPGSHCKLLLPAPGHNDIPTPVLTEEGLRWPADRPRPISRTYTPRLVDPSAGRVVIDFALHQPNTGPASSWAAVARPGDTAVLSGARGAYRIDPDADWTVLVADDTALPAAATILEDAPPGARVLLFAEVHDPSDHLVFATAAALSITWLHRSQEPEPTAGWTATRALADAALPSGRGCFWVGLEATAMRLARRHLLTSRRVDPVDVYTRGYWKYGTANHPDHDTGDD